MLIDLKCIEKIVDEMNKDFNLAQLEASRSQPHNMPYFENMMEKMNTITKYKARLQAIIDERKAQPPLRKGAARRAFGIDLDPPFDTLDKVKGSPFDMNFKNIRPPECSDDPKNNRPILDSLRAISMILEPPFITSPNQEIMNEMGIDHDPSIKEMMDFIVEREGTDVEPD